MTDREQLLERLRSANPLPGVDHVDANELSSFVSYFEERKGAVTTTRTPVSPEIKSPDRRRWRPAIAFGTAAALLVAAVGIVVVIVQGNGEGSPDRVGTPTSVTGATTTTGSVDEEPAAVPPEPNTTTTAPAPFVGVVTLDPDATAHDFGEPSLALDSAGRPQVLYWKGATTVGLATCDDRDCSSSSVGEVVGDVSGLLVGTPRPGAGPILWVGGGGDRSPAPRLLACPEEDCLEPTFPGITPADGWPRPAIAADESGGALVVYNSAHTPPTVSLLRCSETSCKTDVTSSVAWQPPAEWIASTPGAALDNDRALIAIRSDEGILIAECAEPNCFSSPDGTGINALASIPIAETVRGPLLAVGTEGAPIALVEVNKTGLDSPTYLGAVVVAACVDAACDDWVVTELAEITDMYMEWSMATGPDGKLRIAWTEDDSLFLATCENNACSQYTIVDTGHSATDVALAFDPEGAPIIATTSRERGLELLFCGDDSCQIGR